MGRIKWHGATVSNRTHSPLAAHIGGQIFKVRELRQISMRDAATRCNLSVAFFCDMENGKTLPGADTLLKLAQGFSCGVEYFFEGFQFEVQSCDEK